MLVLDTVVDVNANQTNPATFSTGGVTEFARMLAEDLAHRHEVTVLTTQHDVALPVEETLNGVRVVRAPVFARMHKGVLSWKFITWITLKNHRKPLQYGPIESGADKPKFCLSISRDYSSLVC